VIPWIKDHHGYSLAFGVPGILMAIATFIFWLGTKHYVRVPPSRETKHAGFFKVFFHAFQIRLKIVAADVRRLILPKSTSESEPHHLGSYGKSFWDAARNRFSESEIDAAKSVPPILFVFALMPIFWSLFDQTNSTWVLQGQKMVPAKFLGLDIGAEQMQSMNPLIVMLLVPLFTLGIYPRLGRFASPLRRMAYGMFLAAGSYLIVAALQKQIEAGAQLSVLWQTAPYLVLTAAEVLISTTGLEFAFREAAPELKSIIMSFWLLTVAFGDLLVAAITKIFANGTGESSVSTNRFLLYAGLTFIVAILFSLIATTYRYRDAAAAQGK